MAVIGTFVPTKEGGWTGTIRTLTIEAKVRFVPNDNRENESAPAFRIFAAEAEIGAAWRQRSAGENARDYLSVRFDDPTLSSSVHCALFDVNEGRRAELVWTRKP